jgi:DNA replication and repair protein RecF
VLAQARLVAAMTGIAPFLLLDEIAAHLDPDRRLALFWHLDGIVTQCFMSGTDSVLFAALGGSA